MEGKARRHLTGEPPVSYREDMPDKRASMEYKLVGDEKLGDLTFYNYKYVGEVAHEEQFTVQYNNVPPRFEYQTYSQTIVVGNIEASTIIWPFKGGIKNE